MAEIQSELSATDLSVVLKEIVRSEVVEELVGVVLPAGDDLDAAADAIARNVTNRFALRVAITFRDLGE